MTSPGQNVSPAVKELVEWMTARWSNHKKDAAQIIMYRDDIAALAGECGLERVRVAVGKARTWCNFLPEPAELRELLPPVPEYIPPAWSLHDPHCPDCSGSGWKMLTVIDRGQSDRRATRCACRAPAMVGPEPIPNLKSYHELLQRAVEQGKRIEDAPLPDPNRAWTLKKRLAAALEARAQKKPAASSQETTSPSEANTA